MRSTLYAAAMLAALAGGADAARANVIVNGGFESGDTGFSSQYAYQQNQLPESTIYVGGNGAADNAGFGAFAARTGGDMLIANGASVPGTQVWGEKGLRVRPDTTYDFSTWVASLNGISPALLELSINGQQVGGAFAAPAKAGKWRHVVFAWNSGASTTADISLVNANTTRIGNDFALDDIALNAKHMGNVAVPEPASLPIVVAGLAALLFLRRRPA